MTPVRVSEHAVDRWLERVQAGRDRQAVRDEIIARLEHGQKVVRNGARGQLYYLPGEPEACVVVVVEDGVWHVVTAGGWEGPRKKFYEVDQDAHDLMGRTHVPKSAYAELQRKLSEKGVKLDELNRALVSSTRDLAQMKTTGDRALANLKAQTHRCESLEKENERLKRELAVLKGRARE